jgi:hypothetical protein
MYREGKNTQTNIKEEETTRKLQGQKTENNE